MDGFRFGHDVRVRFAETDAQGIAHHAVYVVWLEEARIAYLDAFAGGYEAVRERGIEALTTGVRVDYQRTLGFHDAVRVWTRCPEVRGARFRYEYALERHGAGGAELVAEGFTAHATVDAETRRPMRLPQSFLDAVARAESS